MEPESHLVVAGSDLTAAIVLAAIGYALGRRQHSEGIAHVASTFQIWWYVFALVAALNATFELLAMAGSAPIGLLLALARLKVVAVAIGIWCLGSYILYLWAGADRWQTPLAIFSALHAIIFLGLLETGGFGLGPQAQASADVVTLDPLAQAGIFVLFFAPLILLALGFVGLLPSLEEIEHRFRVTAVASAILLWQIASIVRFNPNGTHRPELLAAIAVLFVGSASITYLAYQTPSWLTERLRAPSERGPVTRP